MNFTQPHLDELNLLIQFDVSSAATGLKVHSDAQPALQAAAQRLFDKGLCTQPDGGYLTHEGIEMAEIALRLMHVLNSALK